MSCTDWPLNVVLGLPVELYRLANEFCVRSADELYRLNSKFSSRCAR